MTNHFAGMALLRIWSINGMLSIGKINPDNKIVGSIKPLKEIIIAVCWLLLMVEIRIPSDNAVTI